jgi:hypothetical protein
MSSLQKFHRRIASFGPVTWPPTTIGMGDDTHGYWIGPSGNGIAPMYVAPKSTETSLAAGSSGILRGAVSTTNGLANTNTLASYGQTAYPAAYWCKNLTTGGYNTWYLPAIDELITCYSNKSSLPFSSINGFIGDWYWSSTENTAGVGAYQYKYGFARNMSNGTSGGLSRTASLNVRAVRK